MAMPLPSLLPNGTVTFLFTDIQGSTRLWEQHPDAMRPALARHDALLREIIEQHSGYVFKTVGDAFCAAFPTAPDALQAVVAAQLAILAEPWPAPITIQVRMALHTGAAELRQGDYFGQPLNRVARLLSAGHGGQTLLSLPTAELTRDSLPPLVSLDELGLCRLRDLSRPETIFQILHPALPSEFPPLKSLDAQPNNLPQQLTSFIGRQKELAEVKSFLKETRLLTLTGSGGCGKTRLSLQAAADVLEDFPDGVWLVELAPLSDPALVPQTVASVLSLPAQAGKSLPQMLTESLHSKTLLLILDNCEHVLSACAPLADALLRACPNVRILVSSREGLGIGGEQTYRVPSLSLPDPKIKQTSESLSHYEAVQLFIARALLAKPEFHVTNQSAPALASVCLRLDGIPLAIELAAARIRSLSVEEINARLDNRFRLLTGGSKTALPRQQTLRALIDWSYDLLTEPEKVLLPRLSVFAGGWTLPAAEAVCSDDTLEDWEILDLLAGLADKSLAIVEADGEGTRYRLLETVRQYGRDRLLESAETEAVTGRHIDYFLSLAEEIRPKLNGPEQGEAFSTLETEHDNLRQALRFCLEGTGDATKGLRLAAALQKFWWTRGYLGEGRECFTALLSRPGVQECAKERADALNGAGALALGQGDYHAARSFFAESLAIRRELNQPLAIATSLSNLGVIAFYQNDYASARVYYEESLTIRRELGDTQGVADSLSNLGAALIEQGDLEAARPLLTEALSIRRDMGDTQGVTNALTNLGSLANTQGDLEAARSLFAEGLAIGRELGDRANTAISLCNLGSVVLSLGDAEMARAHYEESLTIQQELGNRLGVATALEGLATMAANEGRWTQAARLWGAAEALRETLGAEMPPNDRADYARKVTAARQSLGDTAFADAWAAGRALTWEQAVADALREPVLSQENKLR